MLAPMRTELLRERARALFVGVRVAEGNQAEALDEFVRLVWGVRRGDPAPRAQLRRASVGRFALAAVQTGSAALNDSVSACRTASGNGVGRPSLPSHTCTEVPTAETLPSSVRRIS